MAKVKDKEVALDYTKIIIFITFFFENDVNDELNRPDL